MGSNYLLLQGKILLADRDALGEPEAFRWIGNSPKCAVGIKSENLEHKESYSGQRQTDLRINIGKACSADITMEEFVADNVALGLYGTSVAVTGSTVSAETAPTGLVVGDIVRLAHPSVSSLVITDSAGSPATLVLGTNYSANLDHGSYTILNLGALTQPFKAAYTYAARTDVAMFNAPAAEKFLRIEGINLADDSNKVLVEFWRWQYDPAESFDTISEDLSSMVLKGMALADSTKAVDATLGQFGRYTKL
jgi:hypothetical protein